MLQRLYSRESLILAIGIWAIYALLETSISGGFDPLTMMWAASGLVMTLILGAVLPPILRIRRPLARYTAAAMLALIFAVIQTANDLGILFALDHYADSFNSPEGIELNPANYTLQTAVKLTFKFYIWLFGFYAAALAALHAAKSAYEAKLAAQRAELEALRLQVNPHFLFNALNSVSALILQGRHKDAETMTLSVARFYRNNLTADDARMARLADELDGVEAYVELEQVRLGVGLSLQVACPESLQDAQIPPLLLQPLVENAIKHGGGDPPGAAPIALTVSEAGDRLEIVVANAMAVRKSGGDGTGTGLSNVRRRLKAMFGDQARFEAGEFNGHWQATVSIPLARAA